MWIVNVTGRPGEPGFGAADAVTVSAPAAVDGVDVAGGRVVEVGTDVDPLDWVVVGAVAW